MSGRLLACTLPVLVAVTPIAVPAEKCPAPSGPEPNADLAACWWPPQRNVWTPIGWKDHLFRFNVVYNGTVVAQPHVFSSKKHSAKWADQGLQLTIRPSPKGKTPDLPDHPYQLSSLPDGGVGNQGWCEHDTPVLWTEWPLGDGVVLREEVFAHLPGGADVQTGIEPLYAWIRLSVRYADRLRAPEKLHFLIHLAAPHIRREMPQEKNLMVDPAKARYPRKLTSQKLIKGNQVGCHVLEPDGRVRLVAVSDDGAEFTFTEQQPDGHGDYLTVILPVRAGASADLLLPIIPGKPEELDAELALGLEAALAQSDRYWSVKPTTAAVIDTPEPQVNQAIAWSLKLAELITEKNPETGECSFLSGSWQYDALWPTPTSMASHMMLDTLGYHDVVARHIELFRANQGTVKPPGKAYSLHPGYFSSPKTLTSIDWLSDHGAILYQVTRHALLAADQGFTDRWLDPVVKACDFIKDARAITGHDGVPGVLPPAVATDRGVETQSVWTIGWNYKGLTAAVRLLRQLNHPRAEEFAREADDYKSDFVAALRKQTAQCPTWTDEAGTVYPIVADSLSAGGDILHPFYLDAGPIFLVYSGLMDAEDPLMRAGVAFFRHGPNTKLYDPRGSFHQRPVLVHEMSSCEPCYSWNVYHNWQLGDRYRYLEGMYSLLVGSLSPQTYTSCETRHGIYGTIFASPLFVDLVRLAVVDDAIKEGELHLLRLVPAAWLTTDHLTRFENVVTEFGPVSVRFRLVHEGKTLEVSWEPRFRRPPTKVLLHVPPIASLAEVAINGQLREAKPGQVLTVEE